LSAVGFRAAVARLVSLERGAGLERFVGALSDGRLSATSSLAAIQDVLTIDMARADRFFAVLAEAGRRDRAELAESIRLACEAAQAAREQAPTVEVAWTYPEDVGPAVRTTGAVAREIIAGARRSLLVVGYSVTVDPDLAGLAARTIAALARAAARGVVVTAVLHHNTKNRDALLTGWPSSQPPPALFTWPARADDEMASLHAKVLVADADDALVTSANLTYHGFEGNVEMGVRVTGHAAAQLESVFHELIRLGEFIRW
jgi:phosphatidylserine/phosphatidylglycerophosphate/cardiolipin synthase-like enzyme